MKKIINVVLCVVIPAMAGCGGGGQGSASTGAIFPFQNNGPASANSRLDRDIAVVLADKGLTGDPTTGLNLTSIDDPVAQLGMKLFYSKSLGGEMDSACVTCHHPMLGGGDNLSLGVGVHAFNPDLLGEGRQHQSGVATVPRNAPTTFNTGLYRRSLFWDSRVAKLDNGIRTPDSAFGVADTAAGTTLLTAQARFPVTSVEEMRSENFESGGANSAVRNHLAARIGAFDGGFNAHTELTSDRWVSEFQTAFGTSESAESVVTYDNIAKALAAYQTSQVFVNNRWRQYLNGDTNAISENAKRGAVLFFTAKEEGGADCFRCHQGDFFTDEEHHVVGFPQIGPGKGDGPNGDDDFGLARETGDQRDRHKFRTPSLLNVAMTGPYGHAGAYRSLTEVVNHYNETERAVNFFNNNRWCNGIAPGNGQSCAAQYPNALNNTQNALDALADQTPDESIAGIELNNLEVEQIVQFLETLTDPCTQSRTCLAPWIPDATGGPDGNQLNAVDRRGNRF